MFNIVFKINNIPLQWTSIKGAEPICSQWQYKALWSLGQILPWPRAVNLLFNAAVTIVIRIR